MLIQCDWDNMKLFGIVLVLLILSVPVVSAELTENDFYTNTVGLFSKINKGSFDIAGAIRAENYDKVKEISETLIVAIEVYKWKWELYSLSPSAQTIADEVEQTLIIYKSGLEHTIQSIDVLKTGNAQLANQYMDMATGEIKDAQSHIDKINDLIP